MDNYTNEELCSELQDMYDDGVEVTEWEQDFIEGILERYHKYDTVFISDNQRAKILQIMDKYDYD